MTGTEVLDRPSVVLTDSTGVEARLQYIEGLTLEEYFATSETLTKPGADEVTIMDGIPVALTDPIPAGAAVMVGKLPKNG